MTTAAAQLQDHRARKARLWNPPGGIVSSDLEIVVNATARRRAEAVRRQEEARQADMARLLKVQQKRRARVFRIANRRLFLLVQSRLVDRCAQANTEPPLIDGACTWPITIRDICLAACRHFDVNMIDFKSHRKHGCLAQARHVSVYLIRELTTASYPQIGRIMGRYHSPLMHAYKKVSAKIAARDAEWIADVAAVRSMVMEERA